MEDQGKRLMLAVAIAFGIMLIWTALFPPEKPKEKPAKKAVAAETATTEVGDSSRRRGDVASAVDADVRDKTASIGDSTKSIAVARVGESGQEAALNAKASRGEEKFFDFEFENVHARFSSYGAALTSYELMQPRLMNRSTNQPDNLVHVSDDAYRNLRIWFENSTYNVPRDAEWVGEKLSSTELRFTWESSDIRVVKDIEFHSEEYLMVVKVTLDLVNAEKAKQALAISSYFIQDPNVAKPGLFQRVDRSWKAACYQDEEVKHVTSKELSSKGEKARTGEITWGGFDHAYFLSAVALAEVQDHRVDCNAYPLDDIVGGMGLDMVQEAVDLKKGQASLRAKFAVYMGPKYRHLLRDASKEADMDTKFEESVNLGFLAIIAGPLLSLLNFFQSLVVNWGLAILLLTVVVKGLTLPWTHKSMKSMKAMAKLKPQLEKIKEKFKDDKARQQVETMNLFKSHKVNPMSGCLPMLLQMPIWFALYRSLTVAGELYQAPFVAGWIDDLTLPDPFHIMPVMLTGMMFLQTKLTPSTGTGAQQKMLMYGMPIMFGAFSFVFPAGLTLYIFTNTCFTALHHLYMRKSENAAKGGVQGSTQGEAPEIIDVESDGEAVEGKALGASNEASKSKSEGSTNGAESGKSIKSGKSKKKSGQGKKKRKR